VRRSDDLPTLDLPLDGGEDALLLLVDEAGRVVGLGRDLLYQLLRELQLGRSHRGQVDVEIVERTHLVGIEQLLQHHAALRGADLHHVLLGAERPLGERAAARVLHRPQQQAVRLRAALVGRQEVRLVEIDRIDRPLGDEFDDVYRLPRRLGKRLQLLRGEENEAALLEFVAFDHLRALDHRRAGAGRRKGCGGQGDPRGRWRDPRRGWPGSRPPARPRRRAT
jgi:hypothetical protein